MSYKLAIEIEDGTLVQVLFGNLDEYANVIENKMNVKLLQQHSKIVIQGVQKDVLLAKQVIEKLYKHYKRHDELDIQMVKYVIEAITREDQKTLESVLEHALYLTHRGKMIKARTANQLNYIRAIEKSDIAFGIGPAGSGKTFLAVVMAIKAIKEKRFSKIIITRPVVEAGENLGFLPGDLQQKIDPYLRPLHDALNEILGYGTYSQYLEKGILEIVPLAYMRGRTLDNAFIILDEAQNTTPMQMKMFLTRFGRGSKIVVNGDLTQVDLEEGNQSGLKSAESILKHIEGITFNYFSEADAQRHALVKLILEAYQGEEV